MSYQEALENYSESFGIEADQPSEIQSVEYDGIWFLRNANGPLAMFVPEWGVIGWPELDEDYEPDLDLCQEVGRSLRREIEAGTIIDPENYLDVISEAIDRYYVESDLVV